MLWILSCNICDVSFLMGAVRLELQTCWTSGVGMGFLVPTSKTASSSVKYSRCEWSNSKRSNLKLKWNHLIKLAATASPPPNKLVNNKIQNFQWSFLHDLPPKINIYQNSMQTTDKCVRPSTEESCSICKSYKGFRLGNLGSAWDDSPLMRTF